MTAFTGFDLRDDAYWDAPLRSVQQTWAIPLSDDDFEGLLLDAPPAVDPRARERLPLVVAWGASLRDASQAPFDRHAVVVGVDRLRNRAQAGPAVVIEHPVDLPQDPNVTLPEGHMVTFKLLDARERLGLSWEPGDWQLWVLLRERISNPRRVRVGEPPEPPLPPLSASAPPPGQDEPPLPTEAGLALAVERVTRLPADDLVLRGALRLPALAHERAAEAAAAVIGVTLVGVSSLGGLAFVRRVQVPCQDPADAAGLFAGRFAVDLLPGVSPVSHTLFIHGFAGDHHAGPAVAALVAAADLPEGR